MPTTTYTISGTIYDQYNAPLQDVKVTTYQINLRKETVVIRPVRTDANGYFRGTFELEGDQYKSPDVLIKIFNISNKLIGTSPVHFNIGENTVIDYKMGGEAIMPTNEYDHLVKLLSPFLKDAQLRLDTLEQSDKNKDFSFLSGETGEDFEKISNLVLAHKTITTYKITTIAPDIFYGLFRMGLPTTLKELLTIKAKSIKDALLQAIEENIISSKWKKDMDAIVKSLDELAVNQIVEGSDEPSALFKKLFGNLLTEKQQKTFIATHFDTEEKPEKFWDKLKTQTEFNDTDINKAKQVLQLSQLTGNQADLAAYLFSKQSSDSDLKEMIGYAKYTTADWAKHIIEAKVKQFPAWVQGETDKEKTTHFAKTLEQLHKDLYPTAFFAFRMKQDANSTLAQKQNLVKFFSKNTDFDLKSKNIHKQILEADFTGINNKEAVKKELKTINRLYKLTEDYKQVNALYDKNLFSSADIVRKYGRQQFINEFTTATGSAEAATMLYRKAVSVSNKATALITAYKMRNDVKLFAINGDAPDPEGYHEMFGDGELCECEHCQSVYSPAAYFTDMLAFIRSENIEAYNELLRRRPDLDDILLTCKNTNIPLPYIDLVNELLEKEVLRLSGLTEIDGVSLTAHSYQTEGIAAELSAMPEHRNNDAYEPLKSAAGDAVFSPLLPIDLPLDEIRIYTEKLGLTRYELMEGFYGNSEPGRLNDANLAADFLGFSNAELSIINGTNAFTAVLPGRVKAILEKTRLRYVELLQLLETRFLNDDRAISIKQESEGNEAPEILTCNLNKLLLDGATNLWLNKMVRFVRLWKKTGWDIFDLDRTLTAIDVDGFPGTEAAFNENILVPLANIERAKRFLNLPLRQVITLFSHVDTDVYHDHSKEGQPEIPSLYRQVFQNKAVIDDLENSPFNNDAAALSGSLAEQVETLCAVLGISTAEFEALVAAEELNIQNISRLYREVLLAKSLKTPIADLKATIKITGQETDTGVWTPVQLLQFLEEWKIFKLSGIKANEFYSIITNNSGAGYLLTVDGSLIEMVQQTIEALTTIRDEAGTEEQRKIKYAARLQQFLDALSLDDELIGSLSQPLSEQDDIAIKNSIDGYLGAKNKEALGLLSGEAIIDKLSQLKNALAQYLFLKTTPKVFKQLRFLPDEVKWLQSNKVATGTQKLWESPVDINDAELYPAFRKLLHISQVAKIETGSTTSWMELFDIAIGNAPGAKAAWFQLFASFYAVTEPSLVFLSGQKEEASDKGQLNFSFPADFTKAENLLALLNCSKAMEKLGGNIEQVKSLLNTTVLPADAQAVKNLLKSRYGNTEWLNVIKPINDGLRTKRRDALVAWLLANSNSGAWHNSNDLYEWLLIDTEMDACMVTSRLKQGISSIQLFIDRCLMNLETTPITGTEDEDDTVKIPLTEEFAEQWHAWRKQYRVWEANRKIFLYPENWIEPDLRDDKSPFFKELESQLKQNEVTEETAKEALIGYLQKLDTVANLEMVGLFNDEETNTVHVFGRTYNIPHQYFYRKQQNNVWTAWEKVEVDIEGDHILPVVWNGRLMLVWGMFTEKQIQKPFITPKVGDEIPPPSVYLEIKLAWSEYKNGKWVGKKISQNYISTKPFSAITDNIVDSDISMTSYFDGGKLKVKFNLLSNLSSVNEVLISIGRFTFDSCNAKPSRLQFNEFEDVINWMVGDKSTPAYKNWITESRNTDTFSVNKQGLILLATDTISNRIPIFLNTPGIFNITPFRHITGNLNFVPFFYSNGQQNLFVKALQIKRPALTLSGSLIDSNFSRSYFSSKNKNSLNSDITTSPLERDDSEVSATNNNSPVNQSNFIYNQYSFYTFYHPYVCRYKRILAEKGLGFLYKTNVQNYGSASIFTETFYTPSEKYVGKPYPKEEVDFSYTGSYSNYNWELFYHIPLLIATRLTQNQKFGEARKWFHYIFDPTRSSNGETGPERFWITKPFRKEIEEGLLSLEDLLNREENADELDVQLTNWEQNPFNPHAVARLRISAYMRNTVLRYIDNLIQWGDQLFRRDTIESINEATLLYILASNILGKKVETVAARAKPVEKSFFLIQDEIDRFSNVKAEIESFISSSSGDDHILMPFFCLPKNDYLLKYWDTVADRLFKIRHCMNIEGVVRQLPLFEPPIDPALLVRATAAGLDLNTILDDISIGLPNYRFQVILQKANELCNDVKSLGSSLLSALEKKDGEEMALLRSAHELKMLEMIKDIKEKQRDEAKENLESLLKTRDTIEFRQDYYSTKTLKNDNEQEHIDAIDSASFYQDLQGINEILASLFFTLPDTTVGAWSWGFKMGGTHYAGISNAISASCGAKANNLISRGNIASLEGSYLQRKEDWDFQDKSAVLELKQIDKQIIAAEIRLAIAEKEMENHSLQMEQSKEVDDYMRGKFTNAELYNWMVGQISTVYFQSYQLAYTTAKKAEKCMQHELGLEGVNFIQFGYWDSLKKGLLSGDKLQYDLRRLENAYLEENIREYEIVKHVSLVMLDPLALIKLQSTGICDFELPEVFYDMDHSGHYFRRLKSVSISIPCIAGPYTSVSAKLSLGASRYRKDKNTVAEYKETQGSDSRFVYRSGPIQSIATSNAQNDSGVFELNFRDERYLPFEGAGAISNWQLELPSAIRQFDYNTISDVIIHIKYTAREANELKGVVENSLKQMLNEITQQLGEVGLHTAINMRHDLSNEWHLLKKNGTIDLKLDKSRLPYMAQSIDTVEIESVMFISKVQGSPATFKINVDGNATNLARVDELKLCKGINSDIELGTTFTLSVSNADKVKLEDLLLIVKFKF